MFNTPHKTHYNYDAIDRCGAFSATDNELPDNYVSRIASLRKEFEQNGKSNALLVKSDSREGLVPIQKKRKARKEPSKFIKKQLAAHKADTKRFLKGKGEAPHFDFNTNASEWHDSLVVHEDQEVLNRVLGYQDSQDYIPQRLIVDRERPLNSARLLAMAFSMPCLALQKGILLDKKVTTSSGEVGIHYLAMCTILIDMIGALKNELCIFQEVTPFYNYVRTFLLPKVVGQYSYFWKDVPTVDDILTPGVPFELDEPGPNHVSLAWLLGSVNSFGQGELANTIPNLILNDLLTVGVESVAELWMRTLQQSDSSARLISPFVHDRANRSAAAFAIPRDLGVTNYNGYLTLMSEVPILGCHHFMGSTMLVDASQIPNVRGPHIYRAYAGTASYNWRQLNQDISKRKFNPRPRQVALSAYLAQVLVMIIQADFISQEINPVGAIVQPTKSVVSRLNAGDFLLAVISLVLKRYAINNYLMLGTDSINSGTHKLGVGAEFLLDYGSIINGVLPLTVTEGLASLTLKTIKTGSGNGAGEYDLVIPYIIMAGNRINADPLNSSTNSDPLSVMNLISAIYPDVDPGVSYVLGGHNPYQTFNIGTNHTAYLYGDTINASITNFNIVIDNLQGYFDIGMALGNIHEEPYTLADYSYFCTPLDLSTGWDRSAHTHVTAMASIIPFDPDRVADQLTRIIPTVYGAEFDTYIAMTGETTSLQLSIQMIQQIASNAIPDVHPVAGRGSETSIMDYAVTYRGEGGGVLDFFKKVGKKAIPLIAMALGKLTDNYAPGSSSLIQGIGDDITGLLGEGHETPFVRGLLRKGHVNPYATVFRPITDYTKISSQQCHITPKHTYY